MPIPLDKFKDLPVVEAGAEGVGQAKVSNHDLLTKLSAEALSTKEVAAFCKIQGGSANTRMRKLEAKGLAERRQGEAKQYWAAVEGWEEKLTAEDEEEESESEEEYDEEEEEEDF